MLNDYNLKDSFIVLSNKEEIKINEIKLKELQLCYEDKLLTNHNPTKLNMILQDMYFIDYNNYWKVFYKTISLNKIRNLIFKFHHNILIFSNKTNSNCPLCNNTDDIIHSIYNCSYYNNNRLIIESLFDKVFKEKINLTNQYSISLYYKSPNKKIKCCLALILP